MTILLIWIFIESTENRHKSLYEKQKSDYIELQKEISKREVDRLVQIFNSIENHDDAIDIGRKIKYGNSGYIFIGDMKGTMLLHPSKDLEGANIFDGKQ